MTRDTHRTSVPDRARRRAIRAHATRLGVPYSVAARLLRAHIARPPGRRPGDLPALGDHHREWVFALRESRRFATRVRDTRLAADLPLGRAVHLTERFPPMRDGAVPLYVGDHRRTVLGMLYAVLAVESAPSLPGAEDLAWVAELGEETAVDSVCSAVDRAARLLLDGDRWRLWTRVEAALASGVAHADRHIRDAAAELDRELRSVALRGSLAGARQTLDAVLAGAIAGHVPGARVRVEAGPWQGRIATVTGARWRESGQLAGYEIQVDAQTLVVAEGHLTARP